mmetsp:Transcript_21822/g.43910  ORF Transcript_21822/g.43910 Transcript_21822/m.43910 type:complete len:207 (-) Transcript_21822:17-637(-)
MEALGPNDRSFKFVVNPRRGKVSGSSKTSTAPVELSLEVLQPYFRRPMREACSELGLSASAIKKACRAFGIPKWPCRSLTARQSIDREGMEDVLEGRVSSSLFASANLPPQPTSSGARSDPAVHRCLHEPVHQIAETGVVGSEFSEQQSHTLHIVHDTEALWNTSIGGDREGTSALLSDLNTTTPKGGFGKTTDLVGAPWHHFATL